MKMRSVVGLVAACVLSCGLAVSAQHVYAVYYSRSPGQDLEVNLINATASDNTYEITAFDVLGSTSWEATAQLAPSDATFYLLSEYLPEAAAQWGVLLIVSASELVLGLEYSFQGQLYAVEIVTDEVVIPSEETAYSLVAYHTAVSDAVTAAILMNPFLVDASGRLIVRGADGSILHQADVSLSPRASDILNLAEIVGQGARNWGAVELEIDEGMMILACKYFKSGIIQVANVSTARPAGSVPAEPSADAGQKED